jgi:hypothetical protein
VLSVELQKSRFAAATGNGGLAVPLWR